jgi:GAF domain-containing protein
MAITNKNRNSKTKNGKPSPNVRKYSSFANTNGTKPSDLSEKPVRSLESEIVKLRTEVRGLQDSLKREHSERLSLARQHASLEARYTRLSRFYVTVQQLLSQKTRESVFVTIREVIANLVGCEEIGIFRLDESRLYLRLASSMGVDACQIEPIPVGSSLMGTSLMKGEMYLGGESKIRHPQEAGILACIPIRTAHYLYGVIAIFHLLPQKMNLEKEDQELLEILGKMAATALPCTADHHPIAVFKENADVLV